MQNLYLMPADPNNLQQSISASVSLSKVVCELTPSDAQHLRNRFVDQCVHCWAFSNDNSYYKKMQEGDIVLFRINGQTNFSYQGTIVFTAISKTLGRKIWPSQSLGGAWEYIFFLKDIARVDISARRLYREIGYAENFANQGGIRVAPEKIRPVLNRYESLSHFLDSIEKNLPLPTDGAVLAAPGGTRVIIRKPRGLQKPSLQLDSFPLRKIQIDDEDIKI